MAEPPERRSALAEVCRAGTFGARRDGGPSVTLAERHGLTLVHLAGRPSDAAFLARARAALALDLLLTPNTVAHGEGLAVFWLAPTRWLIESRTSAPAVLEARLREGVARSGAVNDVSGGRTVVRVGGADARALLAKGCPLDLHPATFEAGTCAQSTLAGAAVLIHALPGGERIDLYAARTYALHLWHWLTDAAAEFGYAVAVPQT